MAAQITGSDEALKEQAIIRLYAAVSQDAKLAQTGAGSSQLGAFYDILDTGLPQFIKSLAAAVLRSETGHSLLVST